MIIQKMKLTLPPHIFKRFKNFNNFQKKGYLCQNTFKWPKKVFNVKNYHKSLKIYLFISILNHGDQGKLLFCDTYECQ
jgi:hypothetical protein